MNQRPSTLGFRLSTRASRGFTLVELLVSIGVLTVLTGTILAGYRNYNNNALFANVSEDIILALREAQVYGVGAKGVGAGPAASFDTPYGIFAKFGDPQQIIFFADTNLNRVYDSGPDAIIRIISWKAPITITKLECGGSGGICTSNIATITFKRPNPDAVISDGGFSSSGSLSTGEITIENGVSGSGFRKSKIIVTEAGQISLQ